MSLKRILYSLLIVVVAGTSALLGAVAGGVGVYRAVQAQPGSLPAPLQDVLPAKSTNPSQTLVLNNTDVETAITKSVQKVGPAVVTVVGTIPGQTTFFGPTGDQTVSGSGFFISDKGYVSPTTTLWKEQRKSALSFQTARKKKQVLWERIFILISQY